MSLTYLSTFTGVGGMDRGFDAAGMHCLGMVEIDKHARAVLRYHWKDVPLHDDIRTAISSGWAAQFVGRVDVLIGGAPCQDLSVAGKRAGYGDGDRSVLFFDQIDLAAHVKARYLVYENVPGLLSSARGADFGAAINRMAEAGYSHIEWRLLDSQLFGVPQRRKRVFVVACRDSATLGGREVLTEPEGLCWDPAPFVPSGAHAAGGVEGGAGAGRGRVYAGGIVDEDIAAPLASLTGGPRTSDIESATFVAETVDGGGQATYWDGGQISDCLDVSMLVKGQMMPEKRRFPAVITPNRPTTSSAPSPKARTPEVTTGRTRTPVSSSPYASTAGSDGNATAPQTTTTTRAGRGGEWRRR